MVQHVAINHRGVDHVFVTEQLLDSTNIVASLKQMRGETVSKSMAACRLSDFCALGGGFHCRYLASKEPLG